MACRNRSARVARERSSTGSLPPDAQASRTRSIRRSLRLRSSRWSSGPSRSSGSRSSRSASRSTRWRRLTPPREPRRIAHMSEDFMPLDGWDHVELWVGNAKQAAYYYEHAFGFRRTAYAGPETGVRDRASYVVEQGDIRLVVTSGLREDSEITRFTCRHGDGAKDIALRVPDAREAYRQAVQRGATGLREP